MLEPSNWLFPIVVSLHNLEEGLYFPGYAHRFRPWQAVGVKAFRFALVVLTVLAYFTAFLDQIGEPRSLAYLHAGYMLAMLLNVFVPHLIVSLTQRRLMPGTVTGVLFIMPVTVTGLYLEFERGTLEPAPFILYSGVVTLVLLVSLPLLFRLGGLIFDETY